MGGGGIASQAQLVKEANFGRAIRENYLNIECFWEDSFRRYMASKDMPQILQQLKSNLDNFSLEYIDRFLNLLELCKIKDSILVHRNYAFTSRDALYTKAFQQYLNQVKNFLYTEFNNAVKFIFSNLYGLIDLPKEVIEKINGKSVIDGGSFVGDTALLFYNMFQQSKIFAFEPVEKNFNLMNQILHKYKTQDRISCLKQGLSDQSGESEINFSDDNVIDAGITLS